MTTSNNKSYLLLDFGGTDLKAAVVSDGNIRSVNRRNTSDLLRIEGRRRFYLAHEISTVVREFLRGYSTASFSGVFISTQMSCAQILGGEEVGDKIISWQDFDSEIEFNSLNPWDHERAGNDLRIGSPVVSWKSYVPANAQTLHQLRLDTLGGYLVRILSENDSEVRHVTDAFALGGYTLPDFTQAPFVDGVRLPHVTHKVEEVAISADFGKAPIFTPVGDQQASLLGVGLGRDEIAINIGTGGQVARITSSWSRNSSYQTRPYFNDDLIATVTHLPAGRLMNEYFKVWRQRFPFSFQEFLQFSNASVTRSGLDSTLELDAMNHLSIRDAAASRLKRPEILPTNLTRVMATKYADAVEQIDPSGKKGIVFAGGLGSRHMSLQGAVSNLTGRTIRSSPVQESTLSGLASLASLQNLKI